jgi:alkanesulfonate monooxygenase SsuD/methylene tetrahydromethanopterin reductase-like flavin-dependent oxidoreductase (luciferase family)
MVAWYVQVGETTADAQHQATCTERWFVETILRGKNPVFEPPGSASWSPMEQLAVGLRRQASAIGTPSEVVTALQRVVELTRCDELMLVSIAHDPDQRRWAYRALADQGAIAA